MSKYSVAASKIIREYGGLSLFSGLSLLEKVSEVNSRQVVYEGPAAGYANCAVIEECVGIDKEGHAFTFWVAVPEDSEVVFVCASLREAREIALPVSVARTGWDSGYLDADEARDENIGLVR